MTGPNYDDQFDVIVVGAGLAGSTAALTMAREGLDVLILERGRSPGAKNMFGGVLYTPTLRELVDLDDAPLERYVAERRYGILTEADETAISMRPGHWHEEPHNDSYTVLRADFDEWFAEQAEEAGATLITETTVTGLIRADGAEDGRIVGVETDRPDGTIRAPLVVLGEGANSLVSEQAGLKKRDDRQDVAVAAKEVIKFDKQTIEDRFRVRDDAGAAHQYFGTGAVGDAFGGAFIYTNKRTISVGVAYRIEDAARGQKPQDTLNAFKQHPAVAPLVAGGRVVEYSAHAIPEGGADSMPSLVQDGAVIVGDAAGLVFNNGVHLEGTNMAVESGYHAGKAIARAFGDDGAVNESSLQDYPAALQDSFVVRNLEHYSWFHETAAADRELLFDRVPRALADAEAEYFRMDRTSKATHADRAKERLLDEVGGYLGAAKLAWKYRRMLK